MKITDYSGITAAFQSIAPEIRRPTRQITPCRFASILIDQHRGMPLFEDLASLYDGLLPAEQSLWAVGVQGIDSKGFLFSRAGLYVCDTHEGGRWKLVLAVDYDDNGQPVLRGGRNPAPSRLAALSWVAAALFTPLNRSPAGSYDITDEAAERYAVRAVSRAEFAAERGVAAAGEMFAHWCQQVPTDEEIPSASGFQIPYIVPLLTGLQLPPGMSTSELPVAVSALHPVSVRAHAVGRYALALGRSNGNRYLELKRGFIQQWEIADRLLEANNPRALAHQCTLALSTIRSNSLSYLGSLDLTQGRADVCLDALTGALKLLEWFYTPESRTENGHVTMYTPGRIITQPNLPVEKLIEQQDRLFMNPAARGVTGTPVQLVDGFMSDGRLPDDGSDLKSA